jgi:ferric-dicitrate binding protein FerR (iron transport regulator)
MDELIIKYFQHELPLVEQTNLLKQVQSDPLLKEKFIEYQKIYTLFELSNQSNDAKEGKENYKQFVQKRRNSFIKVNLMKSLGYAATFIGIVASTWMVALHTLSDSEKYNKLYVPAGQRAQITLSDGTEVWLNAKSTLTYPANFLAEERRVNITGEAYFDVAEDAEKPFIVSSKNIEMKVLGTEFNVYSYPELNLVETRLIEGSLQVSDTDNQSNNIILKPNEQVTYSGGSMHISTISNDAYLLWKEGIYTFDNAPFAEIIQKLELYYDVVIQVESPSLLQLQYTGKFRQRDGVNEILRIIQKIHKFKITKDEDKNIITLRK